MQTMKDDQGKQKENGFTLLEVVLSITLLTIITVSMFGFFQQAYLFNQLNQSKTVAVSLGHNALVYLEKQDTLYSALLEHEDIRISPTLFELDEMNCKKYGLNPSVFLPIVNNVVYHMTAEIQLHQDPKLQDYLLPVRLTVHWQVKEATYETTVEGYIYNNQPTM